MGRYEKEIEGLFDALTSNVCQSRDDIAAATGWSEAKVGAVLAAIRSPAVAEEWGWTVPHAQRGPGEHLFRVVLTEGDSDLDEVERGHLLGGARSTLRAIATEGPNEAHALTRAAKLVTPVQSRRLRRVAKALDGAAAMAEDALDVLV